MLTEQDVNQMFPPCWHRTGYGDASRCEGMNGPCRIRVAHMAGRKLFAELCGLRELCGVRVLSTGESLEANVSAQHRSSSQKSHGKRSARSAHRK